jgi:hypothetical protein
VRVARNSLSQFGHQRSTVSSVAMPLRLSRVPDGWGPIALAGPRIATRVSPSSARRSRSGWQD